MKAAMVVLASAALVCAPALARATDYPSKPITLMIGFAPGGPSDVMARILTKKMEEILKQPMVIEYRAGAGAILDHHWLFEDLLHLLGEDARHHVARSAGREADHQRDRLARIVGRVRRRRRAHERGARQNNHGYLHRLLRAGVVFGRGNCKVRRSAVGWPTARPQDYHASWLATRSWRSKFRRTRRGDRQRG